MGTGTAPSPGGGVPWAAAYGVTVNLVPLLLTGVRHHPPGRTDKTLCRCFGAPACRVFPDHLITRGQRRAILPATVRAFRPPPTSK